MQFDEGIFQNCIKEIVQVSNTIGDGWTLQEHKNGKYMTKKICQSLQTDLKEELMVMFEYHVAYNISYGVPILCFVAWKQDGSLLQVDEYCKYNKNFSNFDIMRTLTQLDHPVLCKPFLTLHPCRTQEIMNTFVGNSKNPVISWLTVVAPFLDLQISENYVKVC